ncbi:MAG: dihydropteroate synthase [Candidatus Nanopelagicales bacterium]|nr:dihydropteroate synthase [Candidatus Nanopelagicales bacterium]MDZ4249604.1 dihydropteroate synthase [Candidatus Nanopelagicales bacterium]MDZ7577630.1 dihydropteroate synthase [Candidatus Nanopelagicales bacterium]
MAIINRTPDSFFDRGATFCDDAAHEAVDRAVAEGADIIDVGGVKAGPGPQVTPEEEIRRVVPFVGEVRDRHPDVVISVDTWRSQVAEAACRDGADLLNDAWGGFDPHLAAVAAEHKAGIVCTHTGGQAPRTRPYHPQYADLVGDIVARTTALADRALRLGVPRESILIDPGHDFGKVTRQSLLATRATDKIVATGWPVLMSLSRKDFVGESLGLTDPADRLVGTLAATAITAWLGARVWRTHDVAATRQTLDMIACIKGDRSPEVELRGLG